MTFYRYAQLSHFAWRFMYEILIDSLMKPVKKKLLIRVYKCVNREKVKSQNGPRTVYLTVKRVAKIQPK